MQLNELSSSIESYTRIIYDLQPTTQNISLQSSYNTTVGLTTLIAGLYRHAQTTAQPSPDGRIFGGRLPLLILIGCLCVQGTIGNLLIIFSPAANKRLRTHTDVFIVNLAVFDLFVTSFIMPSMIPNIIIGGNYYPHEWCFAIGNMIIIVCVGSLLSMAAISMNRFVYVCQPHRYRKIYNKVGCAIVLATFWILTLCSGLPTLLGWADVAYLDPAFTCALSVHASLSYLICLDIFALGIPLLITVYCYSRIFFTVYKSAQRAHSHSKRGSQNSGLSVGTDITATGSVMWATKIEPRGSAIMRLQFGIPRRYTQILATFVLSLLFVIFWSPYSAICLVNTVTTVEPFTMRFVCWFGISNSFVNCVVLGTVNRSYRAAFKMLLRCQYSREQPAI